MANNPFKTSPQSSKVVQQRKQGNSSDLSKIFDFEAIRLKLSSPEEVLDWSYGEITKPETINYRTQKPEKDGLFSERIFGPTKDWECYCGKYKRIRYKGVICDKCGVEVTRSSVRRERMGHIDLAVPVSHIWFLRSLPSKMGIILDATVQSLEQVVYFAGYIVTDVDEDAKKKYLEEIDREYKSKSKELHGNNAEKKVSQGLLSIRDKAKDQLKNLRIHDVLSEVEYHDLSLKYGPVFKAGTGAETLRLIFERIDLSKLSAELQKELKDAEGAKKKKIMRRLRVISGMIKAGVRPEWMFLKAVPVIPPDLRPMVPLDGGRFATSDLNDLYRRVINRNNRLKKLIELKAPEVICRNEKRMLQEAVDALIDNSARRGQTSVTASTGQKRSLKSLADMLKGKQGRFRQNLLGKRVDYSGRSVIVVGPSLKVYECGLPKEMALELFKPFIIHKLIYDRGLAHNVRSASRLIEQRIDEVWDILEEVIEGRYVLLNRAPTLHRLSIQAFKPILIEGKAIQIHPLVCHPFNADFDGDQMAVHIPLTAKALEESSEIMLSKKNILKPSTGDPVIFPSQDMVLGSYYMTDMVENAKGEGKIFSSEDEAILAYEFDKIDIRAKIKARSRRAGEIIETTVGRILFNQILPEEMSFINKTLDNKSLKSIVGEVLAKTGEERVTTFLDDIKKTGFKYVTKSGLSWGMDDLTVPDEKSEIVKEGEKKIELIQSQYDEGLLTDHERYTQVVEVWTDVKNRISELVKKHMDRKGSVYSMINSGARGSWGQVAQMVGMKGLVSNPAGKTIELPVKASFKEGIDELGYFISTHGMRKGLVDTALRTAAAGYLTRRLVDVAQDIVVREKDCGDSIGRIEYRRDAQDINESFASFLYSRTSMEDVKDPETGNIIIKKGEIIDKQASEAIEKTNIDHVHVRSVISCRTIRGVCQACYGYDLGYNQVINLGQAIGIVTAQTIGEPGTQLTMKTFHMGGVAGSSDITQGLPRIEEIFEARTPRGRALISDMDGIVSEIKEVEGRTVIVISEAQELLRGKKPEVKEYTLEANFTPAVVKGDFIARGTNLSEGHIDLQELYETAGMLAVERYIVKEVQKIYSTQGANIHNKHIELIIHQMFSKVRVKEPGDTEFLPGEVVDFWQFERGNIAAGKKNGALAEGERLLLGISKASLSTDSFLSAASFQETTRVLIDAAIMGKEDYLRGLKENVIIGRLIPAGTGYRDSLIRAENRSKQ